MHLLDDDSLLKHWLALKPYVDIACDPSHAYLNAFTADDFPENDSSWRLLVVALKYVEELREIAVERQNLLTDIEEGWGPGNIDLKIRGLGQRERNSSLFWKHFYSIDANLYNAVRRRGSAFRTGHPEWEYKKAAQLVKILNDTIGVVREASAKVEAALHSDTAHGRGEATGRTLGERSAESSNQHAVAGPSNYQSVPGQNSGASYTRDYSASGERPSNSGSYDTDALLARQLAHQALFRLDDDDYGDLDLDERLSLAPAIHLRPEYNQDNDIGRAACHRGTSRRGDWM